MDADFKVSEIRPSVIFMARHMEAQLRKNDYRGGWHNCSDEYLVQKIADNLMELDQMVKNGIKGEPIQRTTADIANFSMMLAENEHIRAMAETLGESKYMGDRR